MKRKIGVVLILILLNSIILLSNEKLSPEMKKLLPFLGKWKTLSVYPSSSLKAPGVLEYKWILGKKWMAIDFIGKHPKRKVWEAYGFFRYDEKRKVYISYDFFDENEPYFSTGYWLNEKTLRFADKSKKWGIDYTLKSDGTIYQENWKLDKGKRIITLKTNYRR